MTTLRQRILIFYNPWYLSGNSCFPYLEKGTKVSLCKNFSSPFLWTCIHTLTYDITSLHSWLKPVSFLFSNLRLKPEVNSMLRNFKLVAADFSLRLGQCPPTVPRRLKACGYHNVVAEGNLIQSPTSS